jgi:hypothetical protein
VEALFDRPKTLDHLCCLSGGHGRNLLVSGPEVFNIKPATEMPDDRFAQSSKKQQ